MVGLGGQVILVVKPISRNTWKKYKWPTSKSKWTEKMDLALTDFEWNTIYTATKYLTKDTELQNFHFKGTHRILACGYNLAIWKIKDTNLYMYQ